MLACVLEVCICYTRQLRKRVVLQLSVNLDHVLDPAMNKWNIMHLRQDVCWDGVQ